MPVNSVDKGTQNITFDFVNPATAQSFNKLMREIMPEGIYYMDGEPSLDVNDDVVVPPLACIIHSDNDPVAEPEKAVAVRAETTESYTVTGVAEATPYIVLRYTWENVQANFMDILAVSTPAPNDLVVTEVVFVGGVPNSLDNTNRDTVTFQADTIDLGQTGVVSTPTGGTSTNISSTSHVTDVFGEIFNRLIDLSGVGNDAVKDRHIDFSSNAPGVRASLLDVGTEVTTGGTAANVGATTKVDAAIQAIATALKDLSGADDASVRKRHVAFGSSATQINSQDIPFGKTLSRALDAHDNITVATSDKLDAIITQLADRIQSIEDTIVANTGAISTLQSNLGDVESKTDYLSALPVGTLLMCDSAAWSDGSAPDLADSTLPGWASCTAAMLANGYPVPNLEDKFLKASNAAGRGAVSGADEITIAEGNLPPHAHGVGSLTASGSTNSAGSHTHSYSRSNDRNKAADTNFAGAGDNVNLGVSTVQTGEAGAHSHSLSVTLSGTTGNGGGASTPISIEPSNYSVIIVRKCFDI